MRKVGLLVAFLFLAAFFLGVSFISSPTKAKEINMPDDVKKIVDKSCFGCHNTDSQNEDAKEDLDFKTLNQLGKVKEITTLRKIAEEVEEGNMPPGRFLKNNPEKKLTEEEMAVLIKWAKDEATALIGN